MSSDYVDILLVEDIPHDVELALHSLKQARLANNILVIRDGEEAVEFIFGTCDYEGRYAGERPKMILLDLKLPLVDGLEVLRQVKLDARTRTIPVVVLTSSREERDIVESYNLGVNSYIVKPVDFEQFADSVRHIGLYWAVLNQPPSPRDQ